MSADRTKVYRMASGNLSRATVGECEYALGPLTGSLGFLTRVIQVQIADRLRANGGLGMSPAVYTTLRLVDANPGIRQVHAARILLIQESNMANLTKDLIERGVIERRGDDTGKRGGLWITDKGREELSKGSLAETVDRSHAAVLSDKEYKELVGLLNRVYRASLL